MHVLRVKQFESLTAYRERWNQLAEGCVFRSWTWLATWWKHYESLRPTQSLNVLLVFEEESSEKAPEKLVAILPCYQSTSFTRGKVLRLLGDGEVCSDHLGMLVEPRQAQRASQAIAEHLVHQWKDWDLIDLSTIDDVDEPMNLLALALESHDCQVNRRTGLNSWSLALPASWEEFLALQSKSHRKQLRRLDKRILETGHGIWHLVKSREEFKTAWEILVDLHQRRRISLGEPGCFASDRWASFHRDVAEQLLSEGRLRLSWLELDGRPAAAEYFLAENQTSIAYQGGLDPDRLDEEPGRLSLIRVVQHAIAEGHQTIDFLRGDEPYKAHWRATSLSTTDLQIVPPRSGARWRHQAWSYLRGARKLTQELTKSS